MSDLEDFADFDPDDDDEDGGSDDATELGDPPSSGVGGGAADADDTNAGQGGPVDAGTDDAGPEEAESFDDLDLGGSAPDRGLGVVAASTGLTISEEEGETTIRAYVTVGNRSAVRIGSYVLVPYPDGERLFCRIAGLSYAQEFRADDATEIHARRAMASDGIDERDFKFIADLDPVAVVYGEGDDRKRRMADRVPKPETVVRRADDKSEVKTGLTIPEDGVFLGHLAVGGQRVQTAAQPPTIDYRLRDEYAAGDPLVFRHTLVAGGTGSGKTHAAKNVLRQFLADDQAYPIEGSDRDVAPGVVVFDPQDEYAQLHDDGDLPADFVDQCEREGIAHGGVDDATAFVPAVGGASYAASHHRAPQKRFTLPFSLVYDNPWLVAGSGLNDNQYDALTFLLRRFRKEAGGSSSRGGTGGTDGTVGTYQDFLAFLDDPALREQLDESGRVHEATYDAVKRRVHGFGGVFDQDATPITELTREFVRPGGVSVVPTYHITDSRTRTTVVLALASLLVDEKLSNDPTYDRIKETPLVVAMDEAHNFLTDADTVQARKVIGKFTDAAKQGRKERLGLFLVTQDPQDVADPVFKQINTRLVLNVGDEDAISAVNLPKRLASKVPYMERGQMVVHSPDNSEPVELIGLPHCLTRHGRD